MKQIDGFYRSKRSKTLLTTIIFAALTVTLILLICSCSQGVDIKGTWSNKSVGLQITFRSDGTYTYITQFGSYEGTYTFDKGKGTLTYNLLGEVITIEGQQLVVGEGNNAIRLDRETNK